MSTGQDQRRTAAIPREPSAKAMLFTWATVDHTGAQSPEAVVASRAVPQGRPGDAGPRQASGGKPGPGNGDMMRAHRLIR